MMDRTRHVLPLLALVWAIGLSLPPVSRGAESTPCPTVTLCFTPGQHCTDLIVKTIGEAHTSIRVQAYM